MKTLANTPLEALTAAGTCYVLAGLVDGTVAWFLPNLAVSADPEDWAFNALAHGVAADVQAAALALLAAATPAPKARRKRSQP